MKNSEGKYDDIINLPRPESKHPKMSNAERAAQFSKFAAVEEYGEAIDEELNGQYED